MKSENLPITGPCPIDLDATDFDRSAKRAHCAHCQKDVHNLSQMSEDEARDFLRSVAGQKVCVSYARDRQGKIRFSQPDDNVVPLTRVRARSRAAAAAGIGLAASLAACTPHDNDRVQKPGIEVTEDVPVHSAGEAVVPVAKKPTYDLPPPQIDPNEMVDGEMIVPEPDPEPVEMVEGNMKVPEPIEMLEGEIEAPPVEPVQMVRGEIAAVEPCDTKAKGSHDQDG